MSARGNAGKRWPRIREALKAERMTFDEAFTQRRGQGTELALTAVQEGYELIVAVGGDGAINEVVNGMMTDGRAINPDATLGIIPSGTGNDLARLLKLPRESCAAARHLVRSDQSRLIDVGEVTSTREGKPERRIFLNDADLGFAAKVVERIERRGKVGGGTIPYFTTLMLAALGNRNEEVAVEIDGRQLAGRMTTILVCNGQSTGGGMWVAPNAELDDGVFDVVLIEDLRPWEILWHAPKIYRGAHLRMRQVSVHRARTVSVTSPERLPIVADGELIGTAPASFRLLPAALRVRI